MIKKILKLLENTYLRYWGIAFILVLFAAVSVVWELPANWKKPVHFSDLNQGQVQQAAFHYQDATPSTVDEPEATPTITPFPPELLANYKQTTGVIIFAAAVVLIIVGGVFFQLLRERNSPP